MEYRCKQDEVLDAICYQQYGATAGYVEKVLDVNPGLADHGTHLPHGLLIELPEFAEKLNTIEKPVQLWD